MTKNRGRGMITAENRIGPWVLGAGNCGRLKKETGENPVRTRHRNEGADAGKSLGNWEDGGCVDF